MRINDQVVPRQYDAYFHLAWYTPTVPMEYGDYTLFVSAEDMAGNATSLSVDFEIAESQIPVSITKTVTPQGPVNYGDELVYTLVISAAPGALLRLYDPLTDTTFMRFLPQAHPPGVEHVNGVITGTLAAIASPMNQITVSFVARVDVPGTAGLTVDVSNRACVYLFGGTLGDRICSNTVTNVAFRLYGVYLPLVLRSD